MAFLKRKNSFSLFFRYCANIHSRKTVAIICPATLKVAPLDVKYLGHHVRASPPNCREHPLTDTVSQATRSRMMAAIRGRDTKPELVVRRILLSLRVGYRLHVGNLPGCPDIVMAGRRKIIDVRGCFWHRHPGCAMAYMPKSNRDFWQAKFKANVTRDQRNAEKLEAGGWQVLTVWECESTNASVLQGRIRTFIKSNGRRGKGRHILNRAEDCASAHRGKAANP